MKARSSEMILADILNSVKSAQDRLVLAAKFRMLAGVTLYFPTVNDRPRQIREVRNMLDQGMPPGDVVETIRVRWGKSQRSAWRYIKSAKELRQVSEEHGTN